MEMAPGIIPITFLPMTPGLTFTLYEYDSPNFMSPYFSKALSIQKAAATLPDVPVPLPWQRVSLRNEMFLSRISLVTSFFDMLRSLCHASCAFEFMLIMAMRAKAIMVLIYFWEFSF